VKFHRLSVYFKGDYMKHFFAFMVVALLALSLLAACAKYDYHSKIEITNEDILDYDLDLK